MVVELDAAALIRAVERPDSQEARTLDRVAAKEIEASVDAAALAAVSRFFLENRSRAFAWTYESHLRRILAVSGSAPKPDPHPTPALSIYNRRDFIRSIVMSAIVGTALVLINVRPGQATGNPADGPDVGRIFLNYLVPFLVASSSAALANHARIKAARRRK